MDLEEQLAIQEIIADWLDAQGVDAVTTSNGDDQEGVDIHLTWEEAGKLAAKL